MGPEEPPGQKGWVRSTDSSRSLNRTSDLPPRQGENTSMLSNRPGGQRHLGPSKVLQAELKSAADTARISHGEYPPPLVSRWTPARKGWYCPYPQGTLGGGPSVHQEENTGHISHRISAALLPGGQTSFHTPRNL